MRIHLAKIAPEVRLSLTGDEPWLARLYGDFPSDRALPPKLSGTLLLKREEGGSVKVTGHLDFAPLVSCSRCSLPIPWPMAIEVDERFLPEGVNPVRRDMNLSAADLDAYYLQEHEVDLEGLINDLVQTALPMRLTPANDDGACRVCGIDVDDDRVFSGGDEEPGREAPARSPFAVLKRVTPKD